MIGMQVPGVPRPPAPMGCPTTDNRTYCCRQCETSWLKPGACWDCGEKGVPLDALPQTERSLYAMNSPSTMRFDVVEVDL